MLLLRTEIIMLLSMLATGDRYGQGKEDAVNCGHDEFIYFWLRCSWWCTCDEIHLISSGPTSSWSEPHSVCPQLAVQHHGWRAVWRVWQVWSNQANTNVRLMSEAFFVFVYLYKYVTKWLSVSLWEKAYCVLKCGEAWTGKDKTMPLANAFFDGTFSFRDYCYC